jgi:MFS family permease
MGFIVSPFLSPFAFGFLVARTTWRWAYGIGCLYSLIVVLLIIFFMEETYVSTPLLVALLISLYEPRIYDRTVKPIPEAPTGGLKNRIEALIGLTGAKMSKYRVSWAESILTPLNMVWRPHLLMVLIFEVISCHVYVLYTGHLMLSQAMLFGFGIGINVNSPPSVLGPLLTGIIY